MELSETQDEHQQNKTVEIQQYSADQISASRNQNLIKAREALARKRLNSITVTEVPKTQHTNPIEQHHLNVTPTTKDERVSEPSLLYKMGSAILLSVGVSMAGAMFNELAKLYLNHDDDSATASGGDLSHQGGDSKNPSVYCGQSILK
jgi:hypothetical protein